ncbi:ABC-three component system protein [Microvirga tunisiensis]|uniref:ABC-three component systems C-terminal domain-containing protein n=1 Tax=Microvirga tunisiensis TaxID=2108360 RepID=A0A5N7N1J8_9HYPH|nr:ABC-three component system protein [Microvirga tunisiensis]MPR11789.1 hypothetical protein [Microvirga tunisiensis]MPR29776.1 hypothetical protein [Microvirga tunisiensis]
MSDANTVSHSATGSALGYYFQAVYALVVLLDAGGDDAGVSVETLDDVFLETQSEKSLHQLKHSIDATTSISVYSDEIWKTLKVWIDGYSDIRQINAKLILSSVATFAPDSPLNRLVPSDSGPLLREPLLLSLRKEAERVCKKRAEHKAAGKISPPFAKKAPGCEAFLNMDEKDQRDLINRIEFRPGTYQITDAVAEVAARLSEIPLKERLQVAERLLEWWDRQVVCSLTQERGRIIQKIELQQKVLLLIKECAEQKLPTDLIRKKPPSDHTILDNIRRQIELVGGDQTIVDRASREEWRARNQRAKWLELDFSVSDELASFDDLLCEEWQDRHDRLRMTLKGADHGAKQEAGMTLLDWSHFDAPNQISPFRGHVTESSLVRGSYQMLANDLIIGWHCDYKELLK